MSPNSNENKNNESIVDSARNYLHGLAQTEEQKTMAEYGQKTSVERAVDKVVYQNDPPKPTDSKDKNVVEEIRDQVYEATMPPDEKKLHEDAKKSIPAKARAEIDEPLGNVKDVIGHTTDGIGHAANVTKEHIGNAANATKGGIGNAVNTTKETLGQAFGGDDKDKSEEDSEKKSPEVPEKSYLDGMSRLGDQVAEQATGVVNNIKAKFQERLDENSAGEQIDRKSSDAKKN